MRELQMEYYLSIGGTDAVPQAHINGVAMIFEGSSDGTGSGYDPTFRAHLFRNTSTDKIVSMIIWSEPDKYKESWIQQSFTDPAYRRQGLHSRLFRAVCRVAKKEGALCVNSGIKPSNKAMLAAAKKQGRVIHSIIMEKKL